MRAVNSSARSPAKTRWVWLSTKPGMTQRPPASMRSSAAAPAAVTATTRPSSSTTARHRAPARADRRRGWVVGDEQADAVDHGGGHALQTSWTADASAARTATPEVLAVADDPTAADHDVADVGRAGGEDHRVDEVVGRGAGQPDAAGVDHERGRPGAPASRRPASGQPSAARRRPWPPPAGRRPVVAPRAGRQPLVELHRPRLLEQVDHRVGVRAQAQRRAGAAPGRPPARCRRPGPARSSGRSTRCADARASTTSAAVRWVACTAVKRGPTSPAPARTLVGVRP